MRFYDRINELKLLSDVELLSHQEAQMTVLIGRRRIGKTELTLKSGERLTLLYFFVARKSEALLCDDFLCCDRRDTVRFLLDDIHLFQSSFIM